MQAETLLDSRFTIRVLRILNCKAGKALKSLSAPSFQSWLSIGPENILTREGDKAAIPRGFWGVGHGAVVFVMT